MIVNWIGHASFLIESAGHRLITDPYEDYTGYPILKMQADTVTVSHEHRDHNAVHHVTGHPTIIKGPGSFNSGPFKIQGFPAFHDKKQGADRGPVTIYRITAEDLTLVHLSDLGEVPSKDLCKSIGPVDILLIPVGGLYTIDAIEARRTVELLEPACVVPMHYKTAHCKMDLAVLEKFTGLFDKYIKLPRLEISPNSLPKSAQLVVLEYLAR